MNLILLAQATATKEDPIQQSMPQSAPQPIQPPIQQSGQPPVENPLDQLKDIHLPDQIDQFPYAIGWWILLGLFLLAAGVYFYRVYQYKRAIHLIIPAKAEIEVLRSLEPDQITAHSIATLSALLKRICLIYFPQKMVASLSGERWLAFLNEQSKLTNNRPFFSQSHRRLLTNAAYQRVPKINKADWLELLSASENCLVTIIKSAAKKKKASSQASFDSTPNLTPSKGSAS